MELGDPGGYSSCYLPYNVSAETPWHYSDSGAAGNVLYMKLLSLNIEIRFFTSHDYGVWLYLVSFLFVFLFHILICDNSSLKYHGEINTMNLWMMLIKNQIKTNWKLRRLDFDLEFYKSNMESALS